MLKLILISYFIVFIAVSIKDYRDVRKNYSRIKKNSKILQGAYGNKVIIKKMAIYLVLSILINLVWPLRPVIQKIIKNKKNKAMGRRV